MYWIIVKQMVWRPFFEEDWPKLTEEAMAPHSSILAWRIPGTGEPGGLPSMGSHRVGHDWSNLAAAADLNLMEWGWVGAQTSVFCASQTCFLWRVPKCMKCHKNKLLAFLRRVKETPGGSPACSVGDLGWEDPLEEGMASHSSILVWGIPWAEDLLGYSPWGCKESHVTEQWSTGNSWPGFQHDKWTPWRSCKVVSWEDPESMETRDQRYCPDRARC